MHWKNIIHEMPNNLDERILVYSPIYKTTNDTNDLIMTYRVIRARFIKLDSTITHWASLTVPTG